jgi:hypothetical protein
VTEKGIKRIAYCTWEGDPALLVHYKDGRIYGFTKYGQDRGSRCRHRDQGRVANQGSVRCHVREPCAAGLSGLITRLARRERPNSSSNFLAAIKRTFAVLWLRGRRGALGAMAVWRAVKSQPIRAHASESEYGEAFSATS